MTDKKGFVDRSVIHGTADTPPSHNLDLAKKKLGITYVGLVANDHVVQQVLPHVFIGSSNVFSHRGARLLNLSLPTGFHFVRRPSKWMDRGTMIWILRLIARSINENFVGRRIILIFDALPVHLLPEVLDTFRDLRIKIVVVPARLTWLLQPLDAYVFLNLKRMIRYYMVRWFLRRNMPQPTNHEWILIIADCIREYLQRVDWAHAFTKTGFGSDMSAVSHFITQHTGPRALDAIPDLPLTLDQLKGLLPRNRREPIRGNDMACRCGPPVWLIHSTPFALRRPSCS